MAQACSSSHAPCRLPPRPAPQAKRRWRLMVKSIPDSRDLEFGELVEALVDRHLPQLREQAAQQQQEVQPGGGASE